GFTVLSGGEARLLLAPEPATAIFGIGKAAQARLARDGYRTVGDLQQADEAELMRRYGAEGQRISRLSRGIDFRRVSPDREPKSVSAETTFEEDIAGFRELERRLWRLADRVSARLKARDLAGRTVMLKLKSGDFQIR